VKVATDHTEKAMSDLEACKKELAEARENLKSVMKDLEDAKQRQQKTESALGTADTRHKDLEAHLETLHESVKSDYKDYMHARMAYLQQQALVAKMEQDIKAAATKVKSLRDGSDEGGGVYPTLTRNAAQSSISLLFTCVVVGLACAAGH